VSRKYLVGPFVCCLAAYTYGNGILPLLPLYAIERGATQAGSGLFLAFAYLCVALGNMAPGLLPRSFHHRRLLLVISGIVYIPCTWLCGHVANVLQLAILTGVSWFFAGILFSQAATLVGLAAEPHDRGTAFGIIGMTSGLGAVIGSLLLGPLADRVGYSGMFTWLAPLGIFIIAGGLLSVESGTAASPEPARVARTVSRGIGGLLVLLLAAQLLAAITNGPANLGRSLSMHAKDFSNTEITLAMAVNGLVSLGLSLVMGKLSDRIGRRWVLIASCAAISASLLLLGFSSFLWQFVASAALFGFLGVLPGVGPSLVVDLDPAGNVGRNVSLYGSMIWVGSIIGNGSSGYAMQSLGTVPPILIASIFPAVAAVLLLFIRMKAGATHADSAGQ
jgi:MFS family permease